MRYIIPTLIKLSLCLSEQNFYCHFINRYSSIDTSSGDEKGHKRLAHVWLYKRHAQEYLQLLIPYTNPGCNRLKPCFNATS